MIAYLVMSYTHPELVRRLVARLRGGLVAVHHDDRRCALGDVDDALLIPPARDRVGPRLAAGRDPAQPALR